MMPNMLSVFVLGFALATPSLATETSLEIGMNLADRAPSDLILSPAQLGCNFDCPHTNGTEPKIEKFDISQGKLTCLNKCKMQSNIDDSESRDPGSLLWFIPGFWFLGRLSRYRK